MTQEHQKNKMIQMNLILDFLNNKFSKYRVLPLGICEYY